MKKKILSLGNDLLGDDGIALIVGDELARLLDIENYKTNSFGFNIIENLSGLDEAIIIDAVVITDEPVGKILRFDIEYFDKYIHLSSPHTFNLPTAIKFLELYDLKPKKIFLYGINIKNLLVFSEKISNELNASLQNIVDWIYNDYSGIIQK